MDNVKIFIACHKPVNVYHDSVYIPIHVGRVISIYKEEMKNMIGDDTGDNISSKNPYFCELTAQYWVWKNIKDVKYVGFCHYRRFFQTKITNDNVEEILNKGNYDVLCINKLHLRYSLSNVITRMSNSEDLQIFFFCLKKTHPEYYEFAKHYFRKGHYTPYNMILMSKTQFDRFAEWQFSILFEMEKYVKLSGYTRARRVYGYYGEYLFLLYAQYNKLNIKFDNCVSQVGEIKTYSVIGKIKNIYSDFMNYLMFPQLDIDSDAVIVGFKQDGIKISYLDK